MKYCLMNAKPKKIYCTVTNDLSQDQRMQRICTTLTQAGYQTTLLGRKLPNSRPLVDYVFTQKRLPCFFKKGKFFYLEYNIRLFFFFLFLRRYDTVCAVDLDTLLAVSWACWWRRKKCIYDAHEYFTELPELVERPKIRALWAWVAKSCIPRVAAAYTVCQSLADIFEKEYHSKFEVVRNVPFAQASTPTLSRQEGPYILLYQGMLNEGRGLEALLEAMQYFDKEEVQLWLVGEGDCSAALRRQAETLELGEKVKFWGFIQPAALKEITQKADLGLNLLENKGLNYYYSLANKFFDYVQAEKPSINMDFPEYRTHCQEFEVAILVPDLAVESLVASIRGLVDDSDCYSKLQANCKAAKKKWTWEQEESILLRIYKKIFESAD